MARAAFARLFCLETPIALAALLAAPTPSTVAQEQQPALGAKESPPAALELKAGVLPDDTQPEARATWAALVEALRPKATGEAATAISAFDLSIKTRVTTLAENGSKQKNDVSVRYRFLHPSFVRTTMVDTKIERMRGPEGDWLWDPAKGDLVQLRGKDFEQDTRELSQTSSMARNYLALAEPGRLRIAHLERLQAPPACLPKFDAKDATVPKDTALTRAAGLDWISITSPDFQVVEPLKGRAPLMFKAQLGLDPKSHLPLIATIWQDEGGTKVDQTAVLVDFVSYTTLDDRLVPNYFRVHDPLLPSSPFAFQSEPRMSVFVGPGSTLRPKLTADDFRPPKKK